MIRAALTIFLLIGFSLVSSAQGQKEQLEQRKAQLLKEIGALKNLQSKENQKEKSVLSKITDSNTKIKLIEQLISNTRKQTKILTDNIYLNQLEINKLNRELKVLKEDYANMIVKAYKNRSEQSRIMFILSSESFLQAYKRMQYMKQYATFRKVQGEEIKGKMAKLEELNTTLNSQKKEKVQLLAENEKDKAELVEEKKEQQKLIKGIQKDKKRITSDIKKMQTEAKNIDRQIDKIVKEAIAEANRKAAAEAAAKAKASGKAPEAAPKASAASSSKITLTKEGKIIADNFKASKGQLPWPVEKGYMSMRYGLQRHPLASAVEVDHSWIEITTEPGSNARAIFGGQVIDVQIVNGLKAVLILHGDYITIYSNLERVSVSKGDKVTLKQNIGTVYTNPVTNVTVIKFMIMQNTTRVNPELWISPLK